jgi:hypothetical protein
MKTRYKRLIVVGCCAACGLLFPLLALLAPGTSTWSMRDSKILIPFYPLFWLAMFSCEASRYAERAIGLNMTSNAMVYTYLLSSQMIIYVVLGIIISFVIYPPWKCNKISI